MHHSVHLVSDTISSTIPAIMREIVSLYENVRNQIGSPGQATFLWQEELWVETGPAVTECLIICDNYVCS